MSVPKQTKLFDELSLPSDLIAQPAMPGTNKLMQGIADILELPHHHLAHAADEVLSGSLDGKIEMLQSSIAQIEDWSSGLDDPARRNDIIVELLEGMRQIEDDLGFADLEAIFMDEIEPVPNLTPIRKKEDAAV